MNELALFNSLFEDGCGVPELRKTHFGMPKVDVKQNGDTYVLDMDLPGLTEKDVDLSLKDNVRTISSTHEEKKENKKNSEWIVHERTSSSFSRSFTLPDDVEGSKISASFKNGVLTITMPRNKALTESKKIAITAA